MASRPASTCGHQASMLRRMSALPAAWSLRWKRTAPQQPACPPRTRAIPSLSSTRRCRIDVRCQRGLDAAGQGQHAPAVSAARRPRFGSRRHRWQLVGQRRGAAGFIARPSTAGANKAGGQHQSASKVRVSGRRGGAAVSVRPPPADIEQMVHLTPDGQVVSGTAGQAAVEMDARLLGTGFAFKHLFDQIDGPRGPSSSSPSNW